MTRSCAWCRGPIPERARRDAVTCGQPCRQARHRAMRYASPEYSRDASRGDGDDASHGPGPRIRTRRLAYADPPYPGLAARYYSDHPDYGGEVDHADLLSRVAAYDGWALSTSAAALPQVLAAAVAQDLAPRVAAWTRGPRPNTSNRYPLNGWEPVVYVPLPSRRAGDTRRVDVLVHGVTSLQTLPSRVTGTKPPAFCAWLFALLGAEPDDELDDLFPGSGIVGRMWDLYRSRAAVAGDASSAAAAVRDGSHDLVQTTA